MLTVKTGALLGVLVGLPVMVTAAAAADIERAWTVRDSVAVRYFVDDQQYAYGLDGSFDGKRTFVPSPDGRHLFFVSHHGDLACDCNVYDLQVFAVDELKRVLLDGMQRQKWRPSPYRRLTFRSARSEYFSEAIRETQWHDDETIVFKGMSESGQRQIYRLNVQSGTLNRLTNEEHDVLASFKTAPQFALRRESIVYIAAGSTEPPRALDAYPMVAPTKEDLRDDWLAGRTNRALVLAVGYRGNAQTLASFPVPPRHFGPWISPDGKLAILAYRPDAKAAPATWQDYQYGSRNFVAQGSGAQFMLVNLENLRVRPLLDAPVGNVTKSGWYTVPNVLWLPDSSRAILVNTALPLTEDHEARRRTSYIVDCDVQSDRWSVIASLAVNTDEASWATAGWLQEGREFLVKYQTEKDGVLPKSSTAYTKRGNQWVSRRVPLSVELPKLKPGTIAGGLTVTLRQSANEPPVVIASSGRHEIALTDPDPALEAVWRARMVPVQWREPDGRTVIGGLMLPRNFSKAAPVPLVIQAYFYKPDLFWPDGSSMTAYAAQPLVNQEIAVLFMTIPSQDRRGEVIETPREGKLFVERVDAAVEALTEQGIIVPSRVGLIGFSRGGYMRYHAITHPGRTRLAAAIVADGWQASYGEYVLNAAMFDDQLRRVEAQHGGGTFWQNKAEWLERAPAFNVDRVQTPVLFAYNGKAGSLWILETLGAFRINRKPFEYLNFPKGVHQLVRPRERLASLDATVDWMRFWLQDKEDLSAEKAERFERWRKIKADWDKVRNEEAGENLASGKPARVQGQ